MLISGDKIRVVDGAVPIAPFLRAPLFLGEGVPYFSIMETQPGRSGYVEVITTTLDREHWGDLWRIEFETDDVPGNAALLTNLLTDRGLTILNWESARDGLSERHITSVLVSGSEYDSGRDLTCRERIRANPPRLIELEEDVAIYFWDQLSMDPEGKVRLKIRPLHFFRKLHESVAIHQRFVMFGTPMMLERGSIKLSERAISVIQRPLRVDLADLDAYPTVDTKDRVIRTLITSAATSSLVHLSASCLAGNRGFMEWLYARLYSLGADIVTAQVRTLADRKREGSSTRERYFETSTRVIDLTIQIPEALSAGMTRIVEEMGDEMRKRFGDNGDATLREVRL